MPVTGGGVSVEGRLVGAVSVVIVGGAGASRVGLGISVETGRVVTVSLIIGSVVVAPVDISVLAG